MLRECARGACDLHGLWVLTLVSARNPPKPTESGKLAPELDGGGVHAGCNVMPDSSIAIVAELKILGCHMLVKKQPIVLRSRILRRPFRPLHVRTSLMLTTAILR